MAKQQIDQHAFLSQAGIDQELTPDCLRLLTAAVGLLEQKSAESGVLSTSTLFLAAVEWGLMNGDFPPAPEGIRRMARLLLADDREPYDQILSEFFRSPPPVIHLEMDQDSYSPFELSPNFSRAYRNVADVSEEAISASDLLISVLRHADSPDYTGQWFTERLKQLGVRPGRLRDALRGEPPEAASDAVWLCQYRRSEMRTLENRLKPGVRERWRTHPFNPDEIDVEMTEGDEVVLWRTIDEVKPENGEKSRGGIVGWGNIYQTPNASDSKKLMIELTAVFPDRPIPRDEVLSELGQGDTNWPGQVSLKRLDENEAKIFRGFQSDREAEPGQGTTPHPQDFHQTDLASDRAETNIDRLGRAPLAFTLAHHINRIWSEQTRFEKKRRIAG